MRASKLFITMLALVFLITPALAEDVTVPINKDYQFSDGIVVHFTNLVISDNYHGNTFSPDPANTKWYDLYYTFENKGSKAQTGHLEVSFYDAQGNKYPSGKNLTDISMDLMQPGTSSDKQRFLEAAVIPKDTKIAGFQVFDGFKSTRFDIAGGPTPTTTTTTAASATSKPSLCLPALLLPLLIIGVVITSRKRN